VARGAIQFRFRGKGGRTEERTVIDRRLAAVVRRCQELPGQELFQYEDEGGSARPIASEDVNDYIRDAAGDPDFSAKDFRSWTATVSAFRALRAGLADGDVPSARRRLMDALRHTADALGNTLAVTRASYVHPGLVAAFEAEGDDVVRGQRATADLDRPPRRDEELDLLRLLRRANRRA